MFDFLSLVTFLTKAFSDPRLGEGVSKLIEWFKTLSPEQQAAYASKFSSFRGYGSSSFGCDAPDCPHDCQAVEDALLLAASGAEE